MLKIKYDESYKKTKNICRYKYIDDDNGIWQCSNCEHELVFIDGGLEENEMHYCPHCGYKVSNDLNNQFKHCGVCKNQEQCNKNHWCMTYDVLKMHEGSLVCDNFLEREKRRNK